MHDLDLAAIGGARPADSSIRQRCARHRSRSATVARPCRRRCRATASGLPPRRPTPDAAAPACRAAPRSWSDRTAAAAWLCLRRLLRLGLVVRFLLRLFLLQRLGDRIDLGRLFSSRASASRRRGFCSGGRRRLGLGRVDLFLLGDLGAASSTGFGVADLFDHRRPASCPWPSFTPLVISENCLSEMMSTGSASCGLASSGLAANDISPHNSRAAWISAEIVRPVFISGNFTGFAPPP